MLGKRMAGHLGKYSPVKSFPELQDLLKHFVLCGAECKSLFIFFCNLCLSFPLLLSALSVPPLYGCSRKSRNLNVMWKANSNWAQWHLCQMGDVWGSPCERSARTWHLRFCIASFICVSEYQSSLNGPTVLVSPPQSPSLRPAGALLSWANTGP